MIAFSDKKGRTMSVKLKAPDPWKKRSIRKGLLTGRKTALQAGREGPKGERAPRRRKENRLAGEEKKLPSTTSAR